MSTSSLDLDSCLFVKTVNETDHFSEVVEMRISTFTPELETKRVQTPGRGRCFSYVRVFTSETRGQRGD